MVRNTILEVNLKQAAFRNLKNPTKMLKITDLTSKFKKSVAKNSRKIAKATTHFPVFLSKKQENVYCTEAQKFLDIDIKDGQRVKGNGPNGSWPLQS